MPVNDRDGTTTDSDAPSLRQRLASATGDRHAEAKALADRAGDGVGDDEANTAVREAHGDIESGADSGASEPRLPNELASTTDAAAVRDRNPD
jgi:hypothetical protein